MADYYDELGVGGVRDRASIIDLNSYWRDVRFTYDASGNLEYRGVQHLHNEPTSAESWEIWKFTYTSDEITRIEGPLPGAWSNRASLDWG